MIKKIVITFTFLALTGCASTHSNLLYSPPLVIQPKPGTPLRQAANVQAIWMQPFIDSHDNYHSGSYIYTVVHPDHWHHSINKIHKRSINAISLSRTQ